MPFFRNYNIPTDLGYLFTDNRKVSSCSSWIVVLFTDSMVVTIRPTSKHMEDLAVDTTILSTLAQMSTTNDRQCDASNVSVAGWDYYNALLDENSKIVF